MFNYSIRYKKYNIIARGYVSYIKDVTTNDIYHEIGKLICKSLEDIIDISYNKNKCGITPLIIDYRKQIGFKYLGDGYWIRENILYNKNRDIIWEDNKNENEI